MQALASIQLRKGIRMVLTWMGSKEEKTSTPPSDLPWYAFPILATIGLIVGIGTALGWFMLFIAGSFIYDLTGNLLAPWM